jgi:outer membrane protein OmpA-like peptidoglycan-associated protein
MSSEYTAEVTVLAASGAALGSATGRASARDFTIAHFAFNSFTLTVKDRRALGRLAAIVVQTNVHALSLFGFTDDVGKFSYNTALSQERAGAVGAVLEDATRASGL